MKITKHNICENIDNYLKGQKIRYSISDQDSRGCLYELLISSTSGFIQVEYNLDDENDDYIVLQFYTDIDDYDNSIYHSDWHNDDCETCDSIEGEIDSLVDSVKRINLAISKIETKINQIRDICNEYHLEIDDVITLEYNFD